jgi:hypothetical protein
MQRHRANRRPQLFRKPHRLPRVLGLVSLIESGAHLLFNGYYIYIQIWIIIMFLWCFYLRCVFLHIQQCKSKLPLCTAKVLTCKSCRRREKRSKQSWPRCLGFLACAYNTFHIISNSWHLHIETLFLPLRFSGIKRQNHKSAWSTFPHVCMQCIAQRHLRLRSSANLGANPPKDKPLPGVTYVQLIFQTHAVCWGLWFGWSQIIVWRTCFLKSDKGRIKAQVWIWYHRYNGMCMHIRCKMAKA